MDMTGNSFRMTRLTLSSYTAQTSSYFSLEFALDTSIPVPGQAATCHNSSQEPHQLKTSWLGVNEDLESEEEEQPVRLLSCAVNEPDV